MKCPFCDEPDTKVIDSRPTEEGKAIRRRRECPKCGKRLLLKNSRKNRRFYGCEGYPECDFVSWDKPVGQNCPKCGTYMVEKRNNKGEVLHLCTNESCRYKETVSVQEDSADE